MEDFPAAVAAAEAGEVANEKPKSVCLSAVRDKLKNGYCSG